MEKEKNSQQDLGARSHGEAVSRNESVEKLNEIPGRQIMQEPDPLVEIRSAVHSNYAGMIAMLGADNRVYLGREEHYSYQDGQPGQYDNRDGSLLFVSDQPDIYYFLYGEGWAHTQEEMLERGLTLRQYQEFARLREGVLCGHKRDIVWRAAFSGAGKLSEKCRTLRGRTDRKLQYAQWNH